MKKNIFLVCLLYGFIVLPLSLQAESFKIGLFAGLSTPNDQLNNIYNSDKVKIDSMTNGSFLRSGATSGYHVGGKVKLSMSDNFSFDLGATYNKFPQTNIDVNNPKDNSHLTTLFVTENIISLSAGVNYYFFKTIVRPYVVGNIQYNYMMNAVSLDPSAGFSTSDWPLPTSSSDSRVGFSAGLGTDIDLKLVMFFVEGRYNVYNFIGATGSESSKSAVTLSLGLYF
ncbi:MAG: outer membrane beta-barrel protein [Candidatus Kapabacteria bacterium]|nr:outer membrane beta-barrel protein [Candidatus Kapabacteria bacterium]